MIDRNTAILPGTVNPYVTSGITKLQNFYGLTYEDLFNEDALTDKGVKEEEVQYIKENRDVQHAIKSTEAFILPDGVIKSDRFKEIQEKYGVTLEDTQSEKALKSK